MSALALLSAESMVCAEDSALGLGTAATFLVIARREREIAMMTGDVTALWSVEVTIVMDQDSVAAMTAVKCQILQPLSLPHLCQPLWTLMNLQWQPVQVTCKWATHLSVIQDHKLICEAWSSQYLLKYFQKSPTQPQIKQAPIKEEMVRATITLGIHALDYS